MGCASSSSTADDGFSCSVDTCHTANPLNVSNEVVEDTHHNPAPRTFRADTAADCRRFSPTNSATSTGAVVGARTPEERANAAPLILLTAEPTAADERSAPTKLLHHVSLSDDGSAVQLFRGDIEAPLAEQPETSPRTISGASLGYAQSRCKSLGRRVSFDPPVISSTTSSAACAYSGGNSSFSSSCAAGIPLREGMSSSLTSLPESVRSGTRSPNDRHRRASSSARSHSNGKITPSLELVVASPEYRRAAVSQALLRQDRQATAPPMPRIASGTNNQLQFTPQRSFSDRF